MAQKIAIFYKARQDAIAVRRFLTTNHTEPHLL